MNALTRKPGHALVIGGSIVGSAVAAMLATRFDRVTVIERDALPETPDVRAGVPQGRHVHALLARGATELERLFPGFVDAMVERGATLLDVGRDVAWLTPAGWGVPFESGLVLCCATRNLLEWEIRRRALSHSNVTLQDMTSVTGLVFDATRSRVTGVRVRRSRSEGQVDTVMADLAAVVYRSSNRRIDLGHRGPATASVGDEHGLWSRGTAAPADGGESRRPSLRATAVDGAALVAGYQQVAGIRDRSTRHPHDAGRQGSGRTATCTTDHLPDRRPRPTLRTSSFGLCDRDDDSPNTVSVKWPNRCGASMAGGGSAST